MYIKIDKETDGKLLREFLRNDIGVSSRQLKHLKFTDGAITVNGAFVNVRYTLREGDLLYLATEDKAEDASPYITPSDIPIEILYEDEYVTVVNKPPAMPAHPSLGHRDDTVANALAAYYKDKPYVFRPVNRLDRDTSGVMLTANTHLDAYKLYKAMVDGKIRKKYFALTDGNVTDGRREAYMKLLDGSIVERCECNANDDGAKLAVTEWRTLAGVPGFSAVEVTPITGRTHQIRVCMASIGAPILGDTMYGRASGLISRQALHALSLTFIHPTLGEMTVNAPLPQDIVRAAERLNIDIGEFR